LAAYIQAIPRNRPDYHEVKLEAETKHVDLEMKKAEYDQKFATYAQHCTVVQGSARQISGNSSGASRKSTASSRARRLERINIERLKAEMEAQLQFEKREMEMRIKLADLDAREAFLEMEETESLQERKCESKPCAVSSRIVGKCESNHVLFLVELLLHVLQNRPLRKICQSRIRRWQLIRQTGRVEYHSLYFYSSMYFP